MPPHPREELRVISETAPKYSTFDDTYYQIHCRRGISLRVNQNPVMRVNPLRMFSSLACMAETLISTYGVTAASKRPIRTKRSRQLVPQEDSRKSIGLHLTPTTNIISSDLGESVGEDTTYRHWNSFDFES